MDGEYFDVGLTNPWYVDGLIAVGRIIPNTHVPFGRVPLTIGAAVSAPKKIVTSQRGACLRVAAQGEFDRLHGHWNEREDVLESPQDDGAAGSNPRSLARIPMNAAGEPPIAVANGQVQYAIARLSRIIAAPSRRACRKPLPRSSICTSTCRCLSIKTTAALKRPCGLSNSCRPLSKTPIFALTASIVTVSRRKRDALAPQRPSYGSCKESVMFSSSKSNDLTPR